jgi:glycosyltransferase involved in cell wall biosynthesis
MTTPAISVIIPTYERSWGLRRAIASVLAQTFSDFDLIVSDDCSSDDTADVVRSFVDARILYRRNLVNLGVPGNWSAGLRLAQGEYVCFLMDDDCYAPTFLARRIEVANAMGTTAVFSSYLRQPEDGTSAELIRFDQLNEGLLTSAAYLNAILGGFAFIGTTLYRATKVRDVWPEIEQYRYVVDYALNLHLALRLDSKAFYLSEPDFIMGSHPAQISHSKGSEVYEQAAVLLQDILSKSTTLLQRRQIRQELSNWHLLWGRRAREQGSRTLAWRRIRKSICTLPTNWGAWRQCARTFTRL